MSAPVLRTLRVSLAKPYGVETIYPECDVSRLFALMLRQKTLTRANIEHLKSLGYAFEIVPREGERKVL